MAKTKKKRRRKRRGTQGGSVSTRPGARPRNRQEAKARAQQRRAKPKGPRQAGPPTWKGALGKGLLASVLFFALFAFLFKRPLGASAALGAFTLAFYVPLSYYLDGFMYRRRLAQEQRKREQPRED
jgi:hypothetical protein